jgi:hypothetical protein
MKRMALAGALLVALLLPLGGSPASATSGDEASVRVWTKSTALRGCAGLRYRYALDVPAGESWALELHLVNRRGRTISFGYELKGGDPKKGRGRFQICADDVRPGRYKVKAELIWSHYSDQYHEWARTRVVHLLRR